MTMTKRGVPLLFAGALFFTGAANCDQNAPGNGGALNVSAVGTPCAAGDPSCYRPYQITVDGSRFAAGTRVKVYLPPSDQAPEFQGFVVGGLPPTVAADGTFHVMLKLGKCSAVIHPKEMRSSLVVAADNLSGDRLSFAFVPTSTVICQPPYALPARSEPCDPATVCAHLTNDGATTVGMHWQPPTTHNGFYRIRYSVLGDEGHYTEHKFGGDVRDVAVNNLQPGTSYGFIMQSCTEAPTLGRDDCGQWQPVGTAAPS